LSRSADSLDVIQLIREAVPAVFVLDIASRRMPAVSAFKFQTQQ